MTVSELTRDQLICLKGYYLEEHLIEVEGRSASYLELADADEIVPDALIFEAYSDVDFSPDDFVC